MPKFPIVGMQHRKPAPTIMILLPPGTPLFLVREPENAYDPNAIQVWVQDLAIHIGGDSIQDVIDSCTQEEIECPDLAQPVMLGYIKATSINDENLGADHLAPNIDKMIEAGDIKEAKEIPCELFYGASGRPALRIIDISDEDENEPAPEDLDSTYEQD